MYKFFVAAESVEKVQIMHVAVEAEFHYMNVAVGLVSTSYN